MSALQQVGASHQGARSYVVGEREKAFGFVVRHNNIVDAPTRRRAGITLLNAMFIYIFVVSCIVPLDLQAINGDSLVTQCMHVELGPGLSSLTC